MTSENKAIQPDEPPKMVGQLSSKARDAKRPWYIVDAETRWGKPDVWKCRATDAADAMQQAWNFLTKYGGRPISAKYDEHHLENRATERGKAA